MTRYNTAAMKSCPMCGFRDITTETRYGDDWLPSCDVCANGKPEVGYPIDMSMNARVILAARTCQGLTASELGDLLNLDSDLERRALSTALWAAVKAGYLRRGPGGLHSREYYAGSVSWRPYELGTRKNRKRAA